MMYLRTQVAAAVMLSLLTVMAMAQVQPQPKSSAASNMEDVSKWTQKQWRTAKEKWSKETAKWNACQQQANDQKLSGRKSWQFLYDCMMKSG
jgi:hypothetical protein